MTFKSYLLTTLILSSGTGAFAQRQADLVVSILSPAATSTQTPGDPVTFRLKLKNAGPAGILPTDTIGVDIIQDGDTLTNALTGTRPIFRRTGITINAGDSATLTQILVNRAASDGQTVNTCLRAFPLSAAADTVTDPDPGNNTGCVAITFRAPSGIASAGNALSFSIAPVPADGVLRIACPLTDRLSVRITDMSGKTWRTADDYRSGDGLAVKDLPAGLYQVEVVSQRHEKAVKRFVKR